MEESRNSDMKRVLIIDDSPELIEALGNALSKNYKRQFALSGEKALDLLASSKELPDLILLDVKMPCMDGYEVSNLLKKDERLKDIPIIFLSALADASDKIKGFESGGVDYIQKPFNIAEVQARVNTHISLRELQMKLEHHNKHLNQIVEEKVKEISESQMATIYALANLAESRDDETGEHINRVQALCLLLAEKLSNRSAITADFIDAVEKASPLHDIGKVGIKDAILLKPGKLSPEEFEEMKHHTTIGANTLRGVYKKYPKNHFIVIGIEIAQSHHEKWDGSGYPNGLKEEDIPLAARIMALADVYDALRSKRVYKDAFTREKAREIIIEGRGKHFDPLVVDVFLENEQEFAKLYDKLTG